MRIIAGEWRGRRLQPPQRRTMRPTSDRVREAWMSALGQALVDARVLDLYSGSGALGLEALSRGAREVVFVERARGALKVLEANLALVGSPRSARVVREDVRRYVRRLEPGTFDLALADPPYGTGEAAWLLGAFANVPFARVLWVEHRSNDPIPDLDSIRQRRYGDTTLTSVNAP